MTDESYSIKEAIAEFREDVRKNFEEVKEKQDHTNGDVTNLKIWRGYLTGGLTVVSIIVIPLLVYVWNQNLRQQEKLQTLSALKQPYEITK